MYRSVNLFIYTTFLATTLLLSACGGDQAQDAAAADAESEQRKAAMLAEMQNHFDTKVSLPPSIQEDLERGSISQEEVDLRVANGEFPKFFQFKTPAEIPANLEWDDGQDLADIGSPEATKGGTFYLSIDDFPRTLRLFGPDANGSFRPWLLDNTRPGLGRRHPNDTTIDKNGNFRYYPGVAEKWAVSEDKKTVYIKLNPAARFSDGEKVTTDDVLFSFYFWHSKHIQQPWYNNNFQRNYTTVTKYDEHYFALTIPEAKPNIFALTLEFGPLPLHFFHEFGEDYPQRYQWRFVPTTGPYVITDENLKKGRSVTLTRDKDWWAKDLKFWHNRFNADRVHITVIRDQAKRFEAFRKGEISLFSLSLPEYFYEKLPADHELVASGQVHRSVFYNDVPRPTYGLWMNSAQPLLNNRDIRVGINFAINYDKVINEYFRGDYSRMRTTADGFGPFTHPTLKARPFDIEAALKHFAAAGFTQRGPDGVLANEQGTRLSFTLSTGYDSLKDTLTILREEALKAGLELRLEVLDGTASWKKAQEKQHDIGFYAFNVAQEMFPRYWETYHSVNAYDVPWLADGSPNPNRKVKAQSNNLVSIAIPELDKRIEAYRASESAEDMQRLAFEMEEIIYEDGTFVPGFVIPFMRTGYWRWVRWPDDFNVKLANSVLETQLFWIDTEMEKETRDARKTGQTFEVVDKVYSQYKLAD
jgi:microcin C transport system substrate-binding protein